MSLITILKKRLYKIEQVFGREDLINEYLRNQIHIYLLRPQDASLRKTIATEITELGDLHAFRALDQDSVYLRIFKITKQIASSNQGEPNSNDWIHLQKMIQGLPVSTREQLLVQLASSGKITGNESLLKAYFVDVVFQHESHPELEEEIAHDLFGIIQKSAFANPEWTNVYMEILGIAGELELPKAHRDETATWEKLAELVKAL